jgi:hypothetical protein
MKGTQPREEQDRAKKENANAGEALFLLSFRPFRKTL